MNNTLLGTEGLLPRTYTGKGVGVAIVDLGVHRAFRRWTGQSPGGFRAAPVDPISSRAAASDV